jgi:hypothetical protein
MLTFLFRLYYIIVNGPIMSSIMRISGDGLLVCPPFWADIDDFADFLEFKIMIFLCIIFHCILTVKPT